MAEDIKRYGQEYAWANKLFVKSFMERKNKEKKIIDSLYEIYSFYPEYFMISDAYEKVEFEKAVKNVKKAKETIKAILASSAGVCMAEIANLNLNQNSFLAVLGVTLGGSIALYQVNKNDLSLDSYSKKEKKEILKNFKEKCDEFEKFLNDYSYNVQEYVIDYKNDSDINWIYDLDKIFKDNEEYIKSKKEKGLFDKNFNIITALNLHEKVFDIDKFNDSLLMVKELYNKNKGSSRERK